MTRLSSSDEPGIRAKLASCHVPEHMHDGYVRYIVDGYRPGHFLCAVLMNDLFEAVNRADDENRHALAAHVIFLYNFAPGSCFGSRKAVEGWITAAAEARAAQSGGAS